MGSTIRGKDWGTSLSGRTSLTKTEEKRLTEYNCRIWALLNCLKHLQIKVGQKIGLAGQKKKEIDPVHSVAALRL